MPNDQSRIIFTVLPNGFTNGDSPRARLSVLASIRLGNTGTTLGEYPAYLDYPANIYEAIRAFEIVAEINDRGAYRPIPFQAQLQHEPSSGDIDAWLDRWRSLFNESTPVKPWGAATPAPDSALAAKEQPIRDLLRTGYHSYSMSRITDSIQRMMFDTALDAQKSRGPDCQCVPLPDKQAMRNKFLQDFSLFRQPDVIEDDDEKAEHTIVDTAFNQLLRDPDARAGRLAVLHADRLGLAELTRDPRRNRKHGDEPYANHLRMPQLSAKAKAAFVRIHSKNDNDFKRRFVGTAPEVDKDVEESLRLLLYHERAKSDYTLARPGGQAEVIPKRHLRHHTEWMKENEYDFHDRVSLLNNYPPLLRGLGLVFDFVATDEIPMPNPVNEGRIRFNLPPRPDYFFTPQYPWTRFRYLLPQQGETKPATHRFEPQSKDPNRIKNGLINLNATYPDNSPVYSITTLDTDGAALRAIHQANEQNRGEIYRTPGSEKEAAPSTLRTVGFTLVQNKMKEDIEERVATFTEQNNESLDNINIENLELYAEDLMGGIRVDVQTHFKSADGKNSEPKWHSLCRRTAKYEFPHVEKPENRIVTLDDALNRSRVEGFVSSGSTVASDTEDLTEGQPEEQLIYEAVWNWRNWSLAVESPFDPIYKAPKIKNSIREDKDLPLNNLKSTYQVEPHSLPPLRIGGSYRFRCRYVDLAGNGLALGDCDDADYSCTMGDPDDNIGPIKFRRYEPLPSPVVLLNKKLDRKEHPGEFLQHLVVRDTDSAATSRYIAPPRQSLEFCELHGKFDRTGLIQGAFPKARLCTKTGAFPKVNDPNCENDNEPNLIPAKTTPGDEDAIFLFDPQGAVPPDCPYYPDPLARLAIIELLDANGRTLELEKFDFYQDDRRWPDPTPFRIELVPSETVRTAALSIRWETQPHNENYTGFPDRVPVLSIRLNPAEEVQVTISSSFLIPKGRGEYDQQQRELFCLPAVFDKLNARLKFDAALPDTFADALNKQIDDMSRSMANGHHWMIAPPVSISLVHATKRPLLAPAINRFRAHRVEAGQTFVELSGEFSVHAKSTAKLHGMARWIEFEDDPRIPAKPREIREGYPQTRKVFELDVERDPANEQILEAAQQLVLEIERQIRSTKSRDKRPAEGMYKRFQALRTNKPNFRTRTVDSAANGLASGFTLIGTTRSAITASNTQLWVDLLAHAEAVQDAVAQASTPSAAGQQAETLETTPMEFKDTKHRKIEFSVLGVSAFREYFVETVLDEKLGTDAFARASESIEYSIPSCARPIEPDIDYVMPTSRHEKQHTGDTTTSKRFGGGLCVYMHRGWWSSGEGEELAVVLLDETKKRVLGQSVLPKRFSLRYTEHQEELLEPYTSRWGLDPIHRSKPTPFYLTASQFRNGDHSGEDQQLTLSELDGDPDFKPTVDIVSFKPEYDEKRERWFCPIEIDPAASYFPFVRLALARYQPNSLPDMHLSPVVRADFAQLAPDRLVKIERNQKDRDFITVTVSGYTYNDAGGSDDTTVGAAPSASTNIRLTVEEEVTGIDADGLWVSAVDDQTGAKRVYFPTRTVPWRGESIWAQRLYFPEGAPIRLIVEEFEDYYEDSRDIESRSVRQRLVYADMLRNTVSPFAQVISEATEAE